jgi:4-amino-4-deoxy-L-arabinose transferase-like glycosyltransferase
LSPQVIDRPVVSIGSAPGAARKSFGKSRLGQITVWFWLFAMLAGAAQAWVARDTIATDGVSYLDLGDAAAHGHWKALINGYWSPGYPAAIGLGLAAIHPAPEHEFAVMHAVNFAIFLFALASFEFFLRSLIAVAGSERSLPPWLLQIIGYLLFAWIALNLITLTVTSPDMFLAAFVFLSTGILLRIAAGSGGWGSYLSFGAALGLGYYAKAPLFPLAFVFLALGVIAGWKARVPLRRSLLAVLAFAIVVSPLVTLLSFDKHRLTFGDSGKLNYAWYVDGAAYRHWQGDPLGAHSEVAPKWTAGPVSSGIPLHATRKILDSPSVYEFNGPVAGTYPVWYDPSYWNDGIRAQFDLRQEIRKVITNVRFLYALTLNVHANQLIGNGHPYLLFSPIVAVVFLGLLYVAIRRGGKFAFWPVAWMTVVPALTALGMYALVYCEPRHVAPFLALLFLGLFASIRVPERAISARITAIAGSTVLLGFVLTAGLGVGKTVYAATRDILHKEATPSEPWQVAQGFQQLGFGAATKVASLDYANHDQVKWARLAHVNIVAEVFSDAFSTREDAYWNADDATKARVIDAFAKAGAEVVVSRRIPQNAPLPAGWQQIGATRYFVFRISGVKK